MFKNKVYVITDGASFITYENICIYDGMTKQMICHNCELKK